MISSQLYRYPLRDVANNILGYSVGLVGIPIRDILRSRKGVFVSVPAAYNNENHPMLMVYEPFKVSVRP